MKPPTLSSQRRQIERLQARIEVLEAELASRQKATYERLYDTVDAQMKIKQAMAILSGDDQ